MGQDVGFTVLEKAGCYQYNVLRDLKGEPSKRIRSVGMFHSLEDRGMRGNGRVEGKVVQCWTYSFCDYILSLPECWHLCEEAIRWEHDHGNFCFAGQILQKIPRDPSSFWLFEFVQIFIHFEDFVFFDDGFFE